MSDQNEKARASGLSLQGSAICDDDDPMLGLVAVREFAD
jgi:hypothetical protein